MEAGAVLSNPLLFDPEELPDGTPKQISALQAAYDYIGDHGLESFNTEYQQDPPEDANAVNLIPLDDDDLQNRIDKDHKRGVLPAECLGVVVGVDTNLKYLHWQAHGVTPTDTIVTEHGVQHTECAKVGAIKGLMTALMSMKNYFDRGYDQGGLKVTPAYVGIDSGYHEHKTAVYQFCEWANQQLGKSVYFPTKGYGVDQPRMTAYAVATSKVDDIVHVGDEYHIRKIRHAGKWAKGFMLMHMNSDYWKSKLHQGLASDVNESGSIVLYNPSDFHEHDEYIGQILAEQKTEKFVPGRGNVIKWHKVTKHNHQLDAAYSAMVFGDLLRKNLTIKYSPAATTGRKKRPSLSEMKT